MMPSLKSALLTILAALCLVTTASAQSSCSGESHCGGGSHQKRFAYHGYTGGYGYGYRYRPTYAEDYLRGTADLVRSRAMANLWNAQAWTQAEEARSRNLENSVLALNTRLERKRINNESRFSHLHDLDVRKESQTAFVNVSLASGIDPRQPARLTPHELDPATGQLRWPLLLQTQHFARARGPVDRLFATRAKFGEIHPDDYLPFRNWVEKIKAELRRSVDTLPKEDYAVAQNFLRRLISESRLPVQPVVSATQLVSK